MVSLLPTPEPADPVEGAPGHFTHTNWVKQSLKNLDVGTVHTDQVTGLYGRNRIINGDFSVNQRGFTSNVVGAGEGYGFDRWWGVTNVVGGANQSVQTPPLGELPESAKQYLRFDTANQAAAGDFVQFVQKIEDVRTLSGKTVTISFWAQSNKTKIGVQLDQTFGTGGSPSAAVYTNATPVTVDGTWRRYSVTLTLPSIAGKTLGTNNNSCLSLHFWFSAGSTHTGQAGVGIQNGQFNIWGVQVEEGTYATPYEQKSYAEELRACQRYYVALPIWQFIGQSAGPSYNIHMFANLPTPMRVKPTLIIPAGPYTTMVEALDIAYLTPTSITAPANHDTPTSVQITVIGTSGVAAGVQCVLGLAVAATAEL